MEDGLKRNGRELPSRETVRSQMKELINTKEELKIAKDQSMQSWLDSKPLIDELEKLQSGVDISKNRGSISNASISVLQSELEETHRRLRSKMVEELNSIKATNELTQAVDQTCKDLEAIKLEADQQRRERLKLKQLLRMRRQTFRALQLTLRAVRIEAEAFATSVEDAAENINRFEGDKNNNDDDDNDNKSIKLTAEEYGSLARRAEEETSLSQWRVSVAVEQKLAAEASRNVALSRLSQVYKTKKSRRSARWDEEQGDSIVEDDEGTAVAEGTTGDSRVRVGGEIVIPKARARAMSVESNWKKMRDPAKKSWNNSNGGRKRMVKRRKNQSFLGKITNFIRGIKKWFH
ncbi:hypothetical protein LINPERHAP1_LOCUS30307 [Linum perenne]